MKKILSTLIMLSFFAVAIAQKNEIISAKNSYALFEIALQGKGTLKKKLEPLNLAKASIDKATEHEKTKASAEAWAYKAIIYSAIAVNDTLNVANADAAFKGAQQAIAKAKELDKAGKEKTYIESSERNLSIVMQNKGVSAFNKKDYKVAYESFKYIADVMPKDSLYNMYAAISANNAQLKDEAVKYYTKTLALTTKNPNIYHELSRLYLSKADTANALKTIEAGRVSHPLNLSLMMDEINIYINKGQIASQISNIESAIAKDQKNKTLHFVAGVAYSSNKQLDKAEASYKKALEIDPAYSDAIFNLSIIYINRGNTYINEANKLPSNKSSDAKYNSLKGKFEAELTKALPLLEKARELNPKDVNTLNTLKEVYAKLNKMDKAAQMTKALKEL